MNNADSQSTSELLGSVVRVGIVTNVNAAKRIAMVKFPDSGNISDWLPVLVTTLSFSSTDGPQRTDPQSGGSGESSFEEHSHGLTVIPYMPKINDTVLTVFQPIREGQGFIIGGILPWQQ